MLYWAIATHCNKTPASIADPQFRRSVRMRLVRPLAPMLLASLAVALVTAAIPASGSAQGRLQVVSSIAPISSLVRNVGGNRIDLVQLIPDGVDSHTFEPRPSDLRAISRADLFVLNGLDLESP